MKKAFLICLILAVILSISTLYGCSEEAELPSDDTSITESGSKAPPTEIIKEYRGDKGVWYDIKEWDTEALVEKLKNEETICVIGKYISSVDSVRFVRDELGYEIDSKIKGSEYIGSNQLEFLKELKSIKKLTIRSDSNFTGFSFLSELKALTSLNISGCGSFDIAFLSECSLLEAITIDSTPVDALSGINRFSKLKWLQVSDKPKQAFDFAELEGLTALENLNIAGFTCDDFVYVKSQIKSIGVYGEIKPMILPDNMSEIESIDIREADISDFRGFLDCFSESTKEISVFIVSWANEPDAAAKSEIVAIGDDYPNITVTAQ